jgi:transcription initiation factor TFIIIB Brf1 subunit/transcription initiation factor TFIIB
MFRINWKVCLMRAFKRLSFDEVFAAARIMWVDKSTADKIAENAVEVIERTSREEINFYNGKTSRGLISGLFYLLSYRFDSVKKQRELAWKLGTSDVTVRTSYRQWLSEFPDLFSDVIAKFEANKELRYFVLINLKQKLEAKVS